jgi:tetratricopeptide (TPR) repeat protein
MAVQKILLVDEVEANALFFSVVLADLGFRDVLTAVSGDQALMIAKEHAVQFVVAAWEMTSMPGTLLMQKLRTGKRRHIPYLIYSKRMSADDLKLTEELGIKNVLTLPLDKEKAKVAVKAVLDLEASLSPEELKIRKVEAIIAADRPTEALRLIDGRLTGKGPHFNRVHVALGQIWLMVSQLPKAEECLLKVLAEDPKSFEAQNLLAQVYSKQGKHDDAIKMLTAMSESSPKNLTTLLSLGSTYVEADRPAEAQAVFDKVGTLDPDSSELKDERGKLAFKEGNLPLAAQLLAQTQNGDSIARHFNNLAIALTHKQQFDKAIETYENAIKLLGSRAKLSALRYNLGLALAKKGALERSFLELVASYKGDPTFEKAYAALARVGKQMTEKGLAYDKTLVREVNQLRKATKDAKPGAA